MAKTLTPERIDKRLGVIERGLDALPAGLGLWDDDGRRTDERLIRRAAFVAEWADLMDRFDSLARDHAKGRLSDGQTGRLHEIAGALAVATPDLGRLGLQLSRSTEARALVRAAARLQPARGRVNGPTQAPPRR